MKIFILWGYYYPSPNEIEEKEFIGVFSTEEKALENIQIWKKQTKGFCYEKFSITEQTLDDVRVPNYFKE